MPRSITVTLCASVAALSAASAGAQQQIVDPDFTTSVEHPAYTASGPMVAIDESHNNLHTASGQYKPFADLLTSDGYRVSALTRKFEPGVFTGIDVLVIANANARSFTAPAFTEAECDAVRDWVRDGGSLLLISDHAPFGTSAANLAERFGVTMGKGWVAGPPGSILLLNLSNLAREAPTTDDLDAEAASRNPTAPKGTPGAHSVAATGRTQGLAFTFGKGRIVVLGEAAMFSAQVVTLPQGDRQVTFKAGMNAPGNDDRQFALNVVHWLSGILQ